jgi:hypothetical protein
MNRFALVSWPSILVAALCGFVITVLWYRPLLGAAGWRGAGAAHEARARVGAPAVLAVLALLNIIAAMGIALQNGARTSLWFGLHVGLMGALFFIAPALGTVALLARQPLRLWLLQVGCFIVSFSAMGALIGAWPR